MVEQHLGGLVAVGIREGMPRPFAERAERNALAVVLGVGLESRRVDGHGESAVADGEWRQAVDALHVRVVALDDGAAVDGLCRGGIRY